MTLLTTNSIPKHWTAASRQTNDKIDCDFKVDNDADATIMITMLKFKVNLIMNIIMFHLMMKIFNVFYFLIILMKDINVAFNINDKLRDIYQ